MLKRSRDYDVAGNQRCCHSYCFVDDAQEVVGDQVSVCFYVAQSSAKKKD